MHHYSARLVGSLAVLLSAAVCTTAQTWQLDPTFAPALVNDSDATLSLSLAPMTDGRLLARGDFTHADGIATTGVARLRADGTADPGFALALATGETVIAAAPLPDGRVLAVRQKYTQGSGYSYDLLRLLADGRIDPAYPPLAVTRDTHLTALPDGRVLAWGTFPTLGDVARNGLARLNADGTLDATYAPMLATTPLNVSAVAFASDGTLVLTGVAYESTGRATYFFARLLASGTIDSRFAPGTVGTTYSLLAVQPDGSVLAGNGNLARYTPTGVLDRTYAVQIPQLQNVSRIATLPAGRLAVEATVGATNTIGAPAVFTLGADGQVERDFRQASGAREGQRLLSTLANGRALVVQGTLVLGPTSYPTAYSATAPTTTSSIMPIVTGLILANPALALSSVDTNTLTPLPTAFTRRYAGSISRLEMDSAGRVLVAGSFTQIDGQPRAGFARFLASGALDPSFTPAGAELLFAPPDGRTIVRHTTIGPLGSEGFHRYETQIVRLQLDGSVDSGFEFPAALAAAKTTWLAAAPDGRLLIAAFDPDANEEQNLKLIWLGPDGRRGTTLPTTFTGFTRSIGIIMDASGAVVPAAQISIIYPGGYGLPNVLDAAQFLADGRLLVAGAFSSVNGIARPGLVRLLADGSLDASYVPDFDAHIYYYSPLPLSDGRALVFRSTYIGGVFLAASDSTTSSLSRSSVLRLRADGSIDPTFAPPPATIPVGAWRLADGSFFGSGRRFFSDGWPDLNFAPQFRSGTGTGYASYAALTADGRLWLGGTFDQANGEPRSSLARFAPVEVIGISASPQSQTVVAGREAYFQVALGTSHPATYQWLLNGAPLASATGPTLALSNINLTQAGNYAVRVVVDGQTFTSDAATLTVMPSTARLLSFSARSRVAPGSPQIAGLVTSSTTPRAVLLRAIGRGLRPFNVGTAMLPEPVLSLYSATHVLATDRGGAISPPMAELAARVGAFPMDGLLPVYYYPSTNFGSALSLPLGNGVFTAQTSSGDDNSGISLFEIYDAGAAAPADRFLRAASVRGRTGAGPDVLIAGFVIAGNGPLKLLMRGVGPTLAQYGVSGPVADPSITVYRGGYSSPLVSNDNWGGAADIANAALRTGAFPLPAGSKDAALLLTLEPGAYTLQLAAADAAAGGEALVELYTIDP